MMVLSSIFSSLRRALYNPYLGSGITTARSYIATMPQRSLRSQPGTYDRNRRFLLGVIHVIGLKRVPKSGSACSWQNLQGSEQVVH